MSIIKYSKEHDLGTRFCWWFDISIQKLRTDPNYNQIIFECYRPNREQGQLIHKYSISREILLRELNKRTFSTVRHGGREEVIRLEINRNHIDHRGMGSFDFSPFIV